MTSMLIDAPGRYAASDDDWQRFLAEMKVAKKDVTSIDDAMMIDQQIRLAEEALASNRKSMRDLLERDFDEAKHPRDEQGRWTDGGGGDGGEGEIRENVDKYSLTADSLNKPEDRDLTRIVASVPGATERVAEVRAKLEKGVRTDFPVAKGGFKNSDGSWTKARQLVHEDIMDKIITSDAFKAAIPKEGQKPTLHFLGGRGGSGKSWFTKTGKINLDKAFLINNDEIKKMLPEYEGWNSPLLHEEASDIGDRIEKIARDQKLNIVLDGTMRSPKNVQRRVDEYRREGFRIEGHYMYASPATAAKRALERFMRGEDSGEPGRFVPPEYSLESTTNEQSFDGVRDQLDKFEVYDNNDETFNPKLYAAGGREVKGNAPPRFSPGIKTPEVPSHNAAKDIKRGWIATSRVNTIADAQKVAEPSQRMLADVGRDIANRRDVGFKDPGSKLKTEKGVARVEKKAADRGGNVAAVTDIARITFVVEHPEQSDAIFADLAKHFEVSVEPWKLTDVNYGDRTANVRLPNGLIGEVQVMDAFMAHAKSPDGGGGHDWYKVAREAAPTGDNPDPAKYAEANQKMREIYAPVLENYPPEWKAAFGRGGT